ncbi:tol-pal system YbgF family protein [Candidatus Poribacteria bacterium]
MAKITKKQLKEDALLSTTAKLSVFLSKYWGHIVGVIVVVSVLIAAIVLYGDYVTRRNEKTAIIFNEAKELFDKAEASLDTEAKAGSIAKFEEAKVKFQEVSQKSGDSDTISKALFYSAKSSYRLERYSEAVSAFQEFADEYPRSLLTLHVQKAIGNCYEQLGDDANLRKAIQQYDIVLKAPETHTTLEAAVDKGRCYEKLGERDQAIAAYKSITDRFEQNVALAIQNKSRDLVQMAVDVISKHDAIPGEGQPSPDSVKFMDEADALAAKEQWFEALKAYNKAIISQKKFWSGKTSSDYDLVVQSASNALKDYDDSSANVIGNITFGRKFADQGDWSTASAYYSRAVDFDFLPGRELFDKAQFRIHWLNSMKKPSSSTQ